MTLRQAALESENATLRGLNAALPEVIEKRLVGEVISVETSTLRQRLLVNRGGSSGVYRAQPVITGEGVIGQVYRIGPFSSEIILITDSEHALPVQVLRSGVRTIALGTGRSTSLELPYAPQNCDVKVGDEGHFRPRPGLSVRLLVARDQGGAIHDRCRRSWPSRWRGRIRARGAVHLVIRYPAAPASAEALAVEAPAK
jgi:hypothetical protein